MADDIYLQTADYVVAVVMLLIPVGIGVYFAVKDSKGTRDDYLLGGRQMSMLPVALSLFVTFISAIALVGFPSDVYNFGIMAVMIFIGFNLSYFVGVFTMIPLMYPLHLTSIYEYLSLRFESQHIRIIAVAVGMVQTAGFMAIALLTPALGLQAAAGIPLWLSVAIVGIIGTVYTAIGGIKSVVWTDAFQSVVMFIGMVTIIIKGIQTVGSVGDVISSAEKGGRVSFSEISLDPRVRHTWWGTVIGGMVMWFTNIFNQSAIQRVCAMKTIRDAKTAFLINIPILTIFGAMLGFCGIVIYAYFSLLHCDPFEGGLITNRNQLTPYFVLHTLRDLPGMAGLFMATLFSAALSTISSGINAMAAITVEDILRKPLSKVKETTATLITKLIVCVYGLLTVGIAYAANSLKGPLTQIGLSLFGACGAPICGIFFLAGSVPWANKYGSIVGLIISLIFNMWVAMGNQVYGKKDRILTPPQTDMCFGNLSNSVINETFAFDLQNNTLLPFVDFTPSVDFTSSIDFTSGVNNTLAKHYHDPHAYGFFFYDISYEWYALIGVFNSFVIGALVSLCTSRYVTSSPNSKLIFPFARKIWSLPEPIHIDADDSNLDAIENLKISNKKMDDFKHLELTYVVNGNKLDKELSPLFVAERHE